MLNEIVSTTIGGVLVLLIEYLARRVRLKGFTRYIVVLEPQNGQLNSQFYAYFEKCIQTAQEEILITGEGFEYKGQHGAATADKYHSAMCRALERNVSITRIQTRRPLHPAWAAKLAELLTRHPHLFHLYVVDNQEFQDIASVCVIDADKPSTIVEIMLSSEKDLDDEHTRVASTGLFIHGKRALARAIRENILSMKRFAVTIKISSVEQLMALVEKK